MIWPLRQTPADQKALPAICIDGPRVRLRPPQREDWPQWKAVRERNYDHLKPYEPTWPQDCLSLNFFERRLAKQIRDWRLGIGYAFLIFTHDGTLIGGVNINNVCRGAAQYGALGYWIDQAQQGKGLMREALSVLIDFGFSELKLHRFNAGCIAANDRSAALLSRLGFTEEGFARKYVQIDGSWQDHRLFGLTVEDWSSAEKQDTDPRHDAQDQG